MFEKEAKEYAQGMAMYYESAHGSIPSQFEKYLSKAVEFGYNKANEWHFVKDGLPTNTGLYLIYYYNSFFNDKVRCIARYSPDRKEFLNLSIEDGDEVIAWQELPRFPKESE